VHRPQRERYQLHQRRQQLREITIAFGLKPPTPERASFYATSWLALP
jgi:hypothetical protein